MQNRRWVKLGASSVDMSAVAAVVFDRKEARVYCAAGEELLTMSWTDDRAEVASLKAYASPANGWEPVAGEPDDPAHLERRVRLLAVDRMTVIEGASGAVADLFAGVIFLGRASGEEAAARFAQLLGIEP